MRKFAKISAVLTAMVLALAFVGCKDDDDDDDDPSVVTTWYCTVTDEDDDSSAVTETLYFYDDNTFKVVESSEEGVDVTFATGSYTGDTTKDGNIVITIKKIVKGALDDSNSLELVDVPAEYASLFGGATIKGNTMSTIDASSGELSTWLKK